MILNKVYIYLDASSDRGFFTKSNIITASLVFRSTLYTGRGITPFINPAPTQHIPFEDRAGLLRCRKIVVDTSPNLSSLRRKFSTSKSLLKEQKSELDNVLISFPSLTKNLHLYATKNIKECSQVLLKMYNSLTDPIVKLYIQNNCLHLMSLGKDNKEITPRDFPDYKVDGPDKQGHPSLYTGVSGCYAFLCLKTGEYYVGSAICLNTRYKAHKVNSSRPERGGSNSLYLSVQKHG